MASPVGHALVGLALGSRLGVRLPHRAHVLAALAAAALAVAPDLDFLPGLLQGAPALHHQGASHSLLAALAAGGASALLLRRWLAPARAAALGALAWGSHLAIDLLGPDAREPIGLPLLWPASQAHFLAPMTWLPGIDHTGGTNAGTAEWLGRIVSRRNLGALGLEVGLSAPLLGLALRRRRLRQGTPA